MSATAAEAVAAFLDDLRSDHKPRLIKPGARRTSTLSGAAFAKRVETMYCELSQRIAADDTVVMLVRPWPRGIVTMLALIRLGATVVLVDPREPASLTAARLARVEPSTVLAEPLTAAAASRLGARLLRRRGIDLLPLRSIAPRTVIVGGPRCRRNAAVVPAPEPGPDDECLVIFTSGTTGKPRAVVHSQGTLAAMFRTVAGMVGEVSGQIVYSDQYHSVIPSLAAGATVVIGRSGPPEAIAADLAANQVTIWFSTPSTALALARTGGIPATVQHVVLGSAPVTPSLVAALRRTNPAVAITAAYAMTEVVPVAVTDGDSIAAHEGPGTLVGPFVDGIDVKVDPGGEIVVSGPRVGRYLDEPRGHPVHTGDLGRLTADGELVLDGRSKDMILVDGRNIYPLHYEHVFADIDGVLDGALVGIDDAFGNERLFALIELDDPATPPSAIAVAIDSAPDLAGLPFDGIVFGAIPRAGRSNKLDRAAMGLIARTAIDEGSVVNLVGRR